MDDPCRLKSRNLTDEDIANIKLIKTQGNKFIGTLNAFNPNREYSIAITKMEEAVMWAIKGITK